MPLDQGSSNASLYQADHDSNLLIEQQLQATANPSIPLSTSLFPRPERTEGTIFAPGKIHSFLMRAADVAVRCDY